ncbi:class I SAM-dependent methyltransferase [Antarctobacter heliothermus]|uniref:Methyltransferase domain-containing protein n=1 Tax=Antarctobacter heliothermus TaxID=74033 RepID=A0A239M203_9RHOB|nr:class I SAM-dependent methyltransferase [Antarctobacter heliothermus]SNT35949.1 Methyltransferase domain-containing protein [Antarctobacter heliothermus]
MTPVAFWDGIAEKYATQPIGNMDAYEATLERVRHWMRPDMSVMELGCGTGTTALKLADSVAQYLGTDLSGEMVRIANDKAATVDHVSFAADAAGTAGAGQTFDAVLAFNLLHLVDDPAAVMIHVRGLLPKGGLFISKTPCLGGKPWFRPLIWGLQMIGKAPAPVHCLRPAQIEAALAAAGFEVVETGGYPKKLPNWMVVARAV